MEFMKEAVMLQTSSPNPKEFTKAFDIDEFNDVSKIAIEKV